MKEQPSNGGVTLTDVTADWSDADAHVGLTVRVLRYRTRWQRFKHWISVRIFRRPDPDLALIVAATDTTLTLDRAFEVPTGQTVEIRELDL